MVKILITGGAGFIPSCLAQKLAENPDNYLVLIDNFIKFILVYEKLQIDCRLLR